MMFIRSLSPLILLLFFTTSLLSQNWTGIPYGDNIVGFRSYETFDLSREPINEQAVNKVHNGRILQINVWYPAQRPNNQLLSYNDYFLLGGKVLDFKVDQNQIENKAKDFYFRYSNASKTYADSILKLNLEMSAYLEAKPKQKKYPVIFFVHQDAVNISPMAEFIASYGYCVVNFPLLGSFEEDFDFREIGGIESEVIDIQHALSVVKGLEYADTDKIAVIGISFGSLSAVAYALRNPKVRGLISLDGGIAESWGLGQLMKMPYFDLERVNIPILHIATPLAVWNHDPKWFDMLKYAKRYKIILPHMRHGDYSSFGLLSEYFPNWIDNELGKPLGDYSESYKILCKYSLGFLRMIFEKTKEEDDNFMKLDHISYLDSLVTEIEVLKALPPPLKAKQMISIIDSEGIEQLLDLIMKRSREDKTPVTLTDFFNASNALLKTNRPIQVNKLAEFFKRTYPKSVHVEYMFAKSLQELGEEEKALNSYHKAYDKIDSDSNLDRHWKDLFRRTIEVKLSNRPK